MSPTRFDGQKAHDYRSRRSMTIERLAADSSVAYPTLVQYLNGRHQPNVATGCRIADALGVDIHDLLS